MRVLYHGQIEIWKCWYFRRSTRRKTLSARQQPITNSTHIWHQAGIEHRPHWWQASAGTTASCLFPTQGGLRRSSLKPDPVVQNRVVLCSFHPVLEEKLHYLGIHEAKLKCTALAIVDVLATTHNHKHQQNHTKQQHTTTTTNTTATTTKPQLTPKPSLPTPTPQLQPSP